jgi:site-specific DNA-methyltransferase (adenine-specific)
MRPYYADNTVTLFCGDCREITEWLTADVLVTDPPYGIGWARHGGGQLRNGRGTARHTGIAGDHDTSLRDHILTTWGQRPAAIFGSFYAAAPADVRHVAVYVKPRNAGVVGSTLGLRRDVEPIYLTGPWPARPAGRSSVFATRTTAGSHGSPQRLTGHPHTKPLDVMEPLIAACPPGVIADPFAGSGSTLIAARNLGSRAIGVEIDERHCEVIARRLAQDVLPLPATITA